MVPRMEWNSTALEGDALRALLEGSPASPYPRWRKLREEEPVCWHPRLEAWLITR
jgi:hypothetical protein